MISGIYDPTHGDIFYNGRSIVTDKDYLYENIGVYQHGIYESNKRFNKRSKRNK